VSYFNDTISQCYEIFSRHKDAWCAEDSDPQCFDEKGINRVKSLVAWIKRISAKREELIKNLVLSLRPNISYRDADVPQTISRANWLVRAPQDIRCLWDTVEWEMSPNITQFPPEAGDQLGRIIKIIGQESFLHLYVRNHEHIYHCMEHVCGSASRPLYRDILEQEVLRLINETGVSDNQYIKASVRDPRNPTFQYPEYIRTLYSYLAIRHCKHWGLCLTDSSDSYYSLNHIANYYFYRSIVERLVEAGLATRESVVKCCDNGEPNAIDDVFNLCLSDEACAVLDDALYCEALTCINEGRTWLNGMVNGSKVDYSFEHNSVSTVDLLWDTSSGMLIKWGFK
jgi:hypothetical protein